MAAVEPERPQFCPWCGAAIAFEQHEHEPRHEALRAQALARGHDPGRLPDRVREVLAGDAFVGVCARCRTISHVVGHRARERTPG
jgi:hypothetical protein